MEQNDNRSQEVQQGDLDDLPGTYTLDDGHPGSYDHEAVVSVGTDATVTVKCTCGAWEQTGEVRFGDEGDTAVLAEWEAHVYKATGRRATEPVTVPNLDDEGFCASPVGVTMAVMSGLDIVFLWSCLQHADEWATALESEFGMAPERAARPTPTALCGHQGSQSLVSVAVDSVGYAVEVDMDAVRAFNRGGAQ